MQHPELSGAIRIVIYQYMLGIWHQAMMQPSYPTQHLLVSSCVEKPQVLHFARFRHKDGVYMCFLTIIQADWA